MENLEPYMCVRSKISLYIEQQDVTAQNLSMFYFMSLPSKVVIVIQFNKQTTCNIHPANTPNSSSESSTPWWHVLFPTSQAHNLWSQQQIARITLPYKAVQLQIWYFSILSEMENWLHAYTIHAEIKFLWSHASIYPFF